MIGQLHFPGIAWKSVGLSGRDVEKHLVRFRGDHADWAIAYFDGRPFQMRLPFYVRPVLRRQACRPSSHDRFEPLYGLLIRSSADVASAVIMIVSVHTTDFAVLLYTSRPISLITVKVPIELDLGEASLLGTQRVVILKILRIER